MTKCPNCQRELKSGVFSGVKLYNPKQIAVINLYQNATLEGYCTACVPDFYQKYVLEFKNDLDKRYNELAEHLDALPLISLQQPLGWDYTVIDMVSGQSTTGTGVLTEFSSSWADFFGTQSIRHNAKVREGERLCKAQMRLAALEMGADAIIGVDADYSEVGGVKGMLMVAMTGTAIKLHNHNVLPAGTMEAMSKLLDKMEAYKVVADIDKKEGELLR